MYEPFYTQTLKDIPLIAGYIAICLVILFAFQRSLYSRASFAVVNLVACYFFFFHTPESPVSLAFAVMMAVILAHWYVLKRFCSGEQESDALFWISFLGPVALLAAFKSQSMLAIIGASYLSFRMALAAFELRANRQLFPGLLDYIGFLVFPATFMAGPINPLRYHRESLETKRWSAHNCAYGLLRIVFGYVKFRFMATIVNQLSFTAYWDTGFDMSVADFMLCGAAYYLYLYLNFSGYTDMMIGIGAILGIRIKENFHYPLSARNVVDFWRRWHLSLTDFVKDAVFTPIMMTSLRYFGDRFAALSVVVSATALFTVLALWHGLAAGYFIFYGFHAAAFSAIFLSEGILKKRYKKGFKSYREGALALWGGRVMTFLFLSFTCAFLELRTWDVISKTLAQAGLWGG